MEQGAELVGAERPDLHAHEVPVAVEDGELSRRVSAGAHRSEEEHRPRHHQRDEDGDRRVVEEIEIVHKEHEPVVPGKAAQLDARGVKEPGALVVTDAELGGQVSGQEMGERAQGDLPGRRVPHGPFDSTPPSLGEAQGLLGQAGLADACGTVQDNSRPGSVAVVSAQLLQLG
jgi:hypothetical protein